MAYENRGVAHLHKGRTYQKMGEDDKAIPDLTEAIANLTNAIRLNPKNAGFYHSRSIVYGLIRDEPRWKADCETGPELRIQGELGLSPALSPQKWIFLRPRFYKNNVGWVGS